MTTPVLDQEKLADLEPLDVPGNATCTTDYPIPESAWEAYLAALDRMDDMLIALELRTRPALVGDVVELEDFIREQGYSSAEHGLEDWRYLAVCRCGWRTFLASSKQAAYAELEQHAATHTKTRVDLVGAGAGGHTHRGRPAIP